jgi:hypothetical protein
MKATTMSPKGGKPSLRRTGRDTDGSTDWREETLECLRRVIMGAVPDIIEEQKWKKPSNPEGVPVWYHDGIICLGNTLKNSVRLTFPYGAQVRDPTKLFNSRLDSKTTRAVDFFQDGTLDEAAVSDLIRGAARVNASIARERAARAKAPKRR